MPCCWDELDENVAQGATPPEIIILRESGVSSTPQLFYSIIDALNTGSPVPVRNCAQGRAMTAGYDATFPRHTAPGFCKNCPPEIKRAQGIFLKAGLAAQISLKALRKTASARTSTENVPGKIASALLCISDSKGTSRDFRKVPTNGHGRLYSITSSAVARSSGGILKPCALAVFKFAISSNFVGSCTGSSAGFSPLTIRLA